MLGYRPLPVPLRHVILAGVVFLVLTTQETLAAAGDPLAGAQQFRACAACHSLEPRRNRTGPSLAGVLDRGAGTAPGFQRYSPALRNSALVWDATTLDAWITDPKAFVPGNRMGFRGLPDPQARADLIAFLTAAKPAGTANGQDGMMGMGAGDLPNLKQLGTEHRVTAIKRCADGYDVTTADGTTETFWESNLRFKTDGSELGPAPGAPVIVGAGMVGDRASVIFAAPQEISPYIVPGC